MNSIQWMERILSLPKSQPGSNRRAIFGNGLRSFATKCAVQKCSDSRHGSTLGRLRFPRPGLRVMEGRLTEALPERLSPGVILGCPDVDKHSILFGGVHSVFKQSRKDVLLQACGSLRDVFKHGALEQVHSPVDDSRCPSVFFLAKTNDSLRAIESHRSIPARIRNAAYRHADQPAVVPMKMLESWKIKLQERISVHNQELGPGHQQAFCKFECAGRSKRPRLSRICNRNIPLPSVAECVLNLLCSMTRTQHQAANPLRTNLEHKKLEERHLADRRQWLRRRRQHRLQACSHPADEQYRRNLLECVQCPLIDRPGVHRISSRCRAPVLQHGLQCLLERVQRLPTCVPPNLFRAPKNDLFVGGPHQP